MKDDEEPVHTTSTSEVPAENAKEQTECSKEPSTRVQKNHPICPKNPTAPSHSLHAATLHRGIPPALQRSATLRRNRLQPVPTNACNATSRRNHVLPCAAGWLPFTPVGLHTPQPAPRLPIGPHLGLLFITSGEASPLVAPDFDRTNGTSLMKVLVLVTIESDASLRMTKLLLPSPASSSLRPVPALLIHRPIRFVLLHSAHIPLEPVSTYFFSNSK
nr:hypothetical protein Iba_chr14fCG6340 [Ipomoea batatas]